MKQPQAQYKILRLAKRFVLIGSLAKTGTFCLANYIVPLGVCLLPKTYGIVFIIGPIMFGFAFGKNVELTE